MSFANHLAKRGSLQAGKRGLATLCVSGGMGMAVEIETV